MVGGLTVCGAKGRIAIHVGAKDGLVVEDWNECGALLMQRLGRE
jgi:hypothetical protein